MFKRILHKSITILGGAFLCIAVLSLVSCENFLKGADIRSQLEQAVEVANSNPVTIFVTPDENTGTAVPNQVQVKKSYEIILSFKPSGNYKFIKWEVLNRQTGEPVEGAIKFEDETALETKATVLKAIDNLVIHPKCILQPVVEKITPAPANQNYANFPIYIYFNMPMEPSTVDAVSISYFGTPVLEDCFEKPVLNAERNILIIQPRIINLKAFIENQKTGYVDLAVSISETATAQVDNVYVPLLQNANSQFIFRYSALTETISPKQSDYFLSREEVKLDSDFTTVKKFHEDMVILGGTNDDKYEEINTEEKIIDNACGKYVYIYGKFLDADSGVYKVSVFEKVIGTYFNINPQPEFLSEEYYSSSNNENVKFVTNEAGVTTFRIKHYLKSEDCQIVIKCIISDVCGNTTETNNVLTYKKTILDYADSCTINNGYVFNKKQLGKNTFDEKKYNEGIKTIYVENDSDIYLDDLLVLNGWERNFYSIKCKYTTKDGNEIPQSFVYGQSGWELTLDAEKLSGQHLTFCFSDVLGNYEEIECQVADSENFFAMQYSDNTKTMVQTFYSSGEKVGSMKYLSKDNNGIVEFANLDWDDFSVEIQAGYTYRFLPHHEVDCKTSQSIDFFTEIPATEYSVSTQSSSVPKVKLLTPDVPANSYTIKKNEKRELLDVTVKLDADTWNYDYDFVIALVKEKALILHGEDFGDRYNWIDKGDKTVNFFEPQTECTVTVLTEEMYKSNCEIIIYGIKDSVSSEGTTLTIPQLTKTDTAYDNFFLGPLTSYVTNSNDLDLNTFTIKDEQTGVAGCFVIEGRDVYERYGDDYLSADIKEKKAGKLVFYSTSIDDFNASITIPLWLESDVGFTAYLVDNGLNVTHADYGWQYGYNPYNSITNIEIKDNKVNLTVKRESISGFALKRAYFYSAGTADDGSLKWTISNPNGTVLAYYNGNPWQVQIAPEGTTIELSNYPSDSFIKIIFDKHYLYCLPSYIYTGTANTGTYDYVYPPSKNGVAVSSDAPVLCRTICSNKPYSECKDWTMDQWETKLRCIKEEVLNFSPSDHSNKIYKMAYKDTDLQGLCSVVMVYFSDGTKTITSVVQN